MCCHGDVVVCAAALVVCAAALVVCAAALVLQHCYPANTTILYCYPANTTTLLPCQHYNTITYSVVVLAGLQSVA